MAAPREAFRWYARHRVPGQPGYAVVGMSTTAFPDGTVIELPPPAQRPPGWQFEVHVAAPGRLPHRVVVADAPGTRAPALWYVVLPVAGTASGVDLVAFSTGDRPDGDVLDAAEFGALGIGWDNQVGALRWDAATGLGDQIYVAPQARRRGVGTKIGVAAVVLAAARGWAPVRVDGRRTDLGEAWLTAMWPRSWDDLPACTSPAPPMTPATEAVGVPERNLLPDPGSGRAVARVAAATTGCAPLHAPDPRPATGRPAP